MAEVIIISFLFGISQKLADAVNEHKTRLFKGSNIVFGIIFGLSGAYLILQSTSFMEFYIGLVIYWLMAGKLDYFNHQMSGSIMLILALSNYKEFDVNVLNMVFVVFLFFIFKVIKDNLSKINYAIKKLFDKKIHHFFISILFGLWFSNLTVTVSIIFTMLGIMITIQTLCYFNNYKI